MKLFTKIAAAVILAVTAAGTTFAQEELKTAPGAVLMIYSLTDSTRPLPDAEPITAVVDNAQELGGSNVRKNKETQKFANQDVFMVWSGYIAVPQTGKYTLSMSFDSKNSNFNNNVILMVDGSDFLEISHKADGSSKPNDSRALSLTKGAHEITIILKSHGYDSFSIRMWNSATPLRKMAITPATMYHAE